MAGISEIPAATGPEAAYDVFGVGYLEMLSSVAHERAKMPKSGAMRVWANAVRLPAKVSYLRGRSNSRALQVSGSWEAPSYDPAAIIFPNSSRLAARAKGFMLNASFSNSARSSNVRR